MKNLAKNLMILMVITILGIASQSCETSGEFEDVVISNDNTIETPGPVEDDDKSKPGGNG